MSEQLPSHTRTRTQSEVDINFALAKLKGILNENAADPSVSPERLHAFKTDAALVELCSLLPRDQRYSLGIVNALRAAFSTMLDADAANRPYSQQHTIFEASRGIHELLMQTLNPEENLVAVFEYVCREFRPFPQSESSSRRLLLPVVFELALKDSCRAQSFFFISLSEKISVHPVLKTELKLYRHLCLQQLVHVKIPAPAETPDMTFETINTLVCWSLEENSSLELTSVVETLLSSNRIACVMTAFRFIERSPSKQVQRAFLTFAIKIISMDAPSRYQYLKLFQFQLYDFCEILGRLDRLRGSEMLMMLFMGLIEQYLRSPRPPEVNQVFIGLDNQLKSSTPCPATVYCLLDAHKRNLDLYPKSAELKKLGTQLRTAAKLQPAFKVWQAQNPDPNPGGVFGFKSNSKGTFNGDARAPHLEPSLPSVLAPDPTTPKYMPAAIPEPQVIFPAPRPPAIVNDHKPAVTLLQPVDTSHQNGLIAAAETTTLQKAKVMLEDCISQLESKKAIAEYLSILRDANKNKKLREENATLERDILSCQLVAAVQQLKTLDRRDFSSLISSCNHTYEKLSRAHYELSHYTGNSVDDLQRLKQSWIECCDGYIKIVKFVDTQMDEAARSAKDQLEPLLPLYQPGSYCCGPLTGSFDDAVQNLCHQAELWKLKRYKYSLEHETLAVKVLSLESFINESQNSEGTISVSDNDLVELEQAVAAERKFFKDLDLVSNPLKETRVQILAHQCYVFAEQELNQTEQAQLSLLKALNGHHDCLNYLIARDAKEVPGENRDTFDGQISNISQLKELVIKARNSVQTVLDEWDDQTQSKTIEHIYEQLQKRIVDLQKASEKLAEQLAFTMPHVFYSAAKDCYVAPELRVALTTGLLGKFRMESDYFQSKNAIPSNTFVSKWNGEECRVKRFSLSPESVCAFTTLCVIANFFAHPYMVAVQAIVNSINDATISLQLSHPSERTLRLWSQPTSSYQLSDLRHVSFQVLLALDHLHRLGLAHGHISEDTIFLVNNHTVVLQERDLDVNQFPIDFSGKSDTRGLDITQFVSLLIRLGTKFVPEVVDVTSGEKNLIDLSDPLPAAELSKMSQEQLAELLAKKEFLNLVEMAHNSPQDMITTNTILQHPFYNSERLSHGQTANAYPIAPPLYWECWNRQRVHPVAQEYAVPSLLPLLERTMHTRIKEVRRLENTMMWEEYANSRSELEARLGSFESIGVGCTLTELDNALRLNTRLEKYLIYAGSETSETIRVSGFNGPLVFVTSSTPIQRVQQNRIVICRVLFGEVSEDIVIDQDKTCFSVSLRKPTHVYPEFFCLL